MAKDGSERAEALARQLEERFGDRLRSVILYGSAARDDFREGSSDLNVLVLFDEVDEAVLRRCADLARPWAEAGNPPPLLLSTDELRRSLDIFPIEYSEIRESHRVLHGDDPFVDLHIEPEHMRLQCERELKTALIQLREGYLLASDEPAGVGDLLRASVSSLAVYCRTLLRLEGEPVPVQREEVVRQAAGRAGFDPAPMLAVLAARESPEAFEVPAGSDTAVGYLAIAARLVAYVDALSVSRS